jgi:uroporphyrinogen-III synthase
MIFGASPPDTSETRVPVLVSREESHIVSRVPSDLLLELRALSDLYYVPQMNIQPLSTERVVDHLSKLSSEDILFVFTSSSSIESVMPLCRPEYKFAAIGEGTATILRDKGYSLSFIPTVSNQEVFAFELSSYLQTKNLYPYIFIFQGSTASTYLVDYLAQRGFKVQRHISYQVTERSSTDDESFRFEQFLITVSNRISSYIIPSGYLLFFSSLQVEFCCNKILEFFRKSGEENKVSNILGSCIAVGIGQKTADTLIRKGWNHVIVPEEQNNKILFEFLLKNIKNRLNNG